MIEQLEKQASSQLPPTASSGATASARGVLDGQEVQVACRIDRHGRPQFTYAVAGVRMERRTLLMLTCPEAACEAGREVRRRWQAFTGQPSHLAAQRFSAPRIAPLAEEVPVEVDGHSCVARPASFECVTACPVGAHEPRQMRKPGWDLFEGGRYVAGGLVRDERTRTAAPRFPALADAAAWLDSMTGHPAGRPSANGSAA